MNSIVISPEQLATLMSNDKVIVVDTRAPEAYAAGHLPGAVNLREIFTFLASSTAEGLQELKAKFIKTPLSSGYGQSCRGYFLPKLAESPGV